MPAQNVLEMQGVSLRSLNSIIEANRKEEYASPSTKWTVASTRNSMKTPRSPLGFTFDVCSSDNNCIFPRKCTVFNGKGQEVSCTNRNTTFGCSCDNERSCKKLSDCPTGEICATLELFPGFSLGNSCISEIAALDRPEWIPLENGQTLDKCLTQSSCREGRQCVVDNKDRFKLCKQGDRKCACFKKDLRPCKLSSQCELGERCALVKNAPYPICVSDDAISKRRDVVPIGGVLGLESCYRKTDCAQDRLCLVASFNGIDFCAGREKCFCGYARRNCSLFGKNKCLEGEHCVRIKGAPVRRCASSCALLANPNLIPLGKVGDIKCQGIGSSSHTRESREIASPVNESTGSGTEEVGPLPSIPSPSPSIMEDLGFDMFT